MEINGGKAVVLLLWAYTVPVLQVPGEREERRVFLLLLYKYIVPGQVSGCLGV